MEKSKECRKSEDKLLGHRFTRVTIKSTHEPHLAPSRQLEVKNSKNIHLYYFQIKKIFKSKVNAGLYARNSKCWADKMSQWVKALAAQIWQLSMISGTHIKAAGKN